MKRAVGQFTPYYWTSFQWGYTQSFKRFTFVFVLAVIVSLEEVGEGGGGEMEVVRLCVIGTNYKSVNPLAAWWLCVP